MTAALAVEAKHCRGCERDLPRDAFGRDRSKKDGRGTRCKECRAEFYGANRERWVKYRLANRDKIRERKAEHYRVNRDKIREHRAEYRRTNRDKIREREAEYRRTLTARTDAEIAADRARLRPDGMKRCRHGHIAPLSEFSANRCNADGLSVTCRRHDSETDRLISIGADFWIEHGIRPDRCVYCIYADAEHTDHVYPRRLGGDDSPSNLAPACSSCNLSKYAKPVREWLAEGLVRFSDSLVSVLNAEAARTGWTPAA